MLLVCANQGRPVAVRGATNGSITLSWPYVFEIREEGTFGLFPVQSVLKVVLRVKVPGCSRPL